jgi:hypothetical protein
MRNHLFRIIRFLRSDRHYTQNKVENEKAGVICTSYKNQLDEILELLIGDEHAPFPLALRNILIKSSASA